MSHGGRASERGWLLLAMHDPTGRRGLWYRVTKDGDNTEAIEMCAGREGDDAYFKLRSQQIVDRTVIEHIAAVLDYGLGSLMFATREEPPAKTWPDAIAPGERCSTVIGNVRTGATFQRWDADGLVAVIRPDGMVEDWTVGRAFVGRPL